MTSNILEGYRRQFIAPSGYSYTIREQNGADDDILSNPSEAKNLMNISRFIAGIVVDTDYTSNGKLTTDQAHNLPSLDRYAILIQSRIHSLGQVLYFTHDWGPDNGGQATYEQDLEEFLFDYSKAPTEEDLNAKPDAIPYYPMGKKTEVEFTTSSGKKLKFKLLTGAAEARVLSLPFDKVTRNVELLVRNLMMEIDGAYHEVKTFQSFSVKDMYEIRQQVAMNDPVFRGTTKIDNPHREGQSENISLMGIPNFFFLGEI